MRPRIYGSSDSHRVRSSIWPDPGAGTGIASIRKSLSFGSPTGRAARTMRVPAVTSGPARIVRALAGDAHVMHVALTQSRRRDANKLRFLMELGEVLGADITHRRAQATGELVQHGGDRTLVGHLPLDAFRHELEVILNILLEVAVGRAARHRADRAHAAIALVGTALVEERLARRLVGAGEQR